MKHKIHCNQCVPMMINSIFCHETGCPNQRKKYNSESGEWISVYKCDICGEVIEEGNYCLCQTEDEDEI